MAASKNERREVIASGSPLGKHSLNQGKMYISRQGAERIDPKRGPGNKKIRKNPESQTTSLQKNEEIAISENGELIIVENERCYSYEIVVEPNGKITLKPSP